MSSTLVEVCYTPLLYPVYKREDNIVVVIDVLRATSAICTALHYGAEKIIPVASVEEATKLKAQGLMVGAERDAVRLEGFDFGNSPYDYMRDDIKGKTLGLTTTNGTQAIEASKDAYQVVIGAFSNFNVLTRYLIEQERGVLLLCSGWKNRFNLEDAMFAGAVAKALSFKGSPLKLGDAALAAKHLYRVGKEDPDKFLRKSSHKERLARLGLKKDIRYCLSFDKAPVLPVLKEGAISL